MFSKMNTKFTLHVERTNIAGATGSPQGVLFAEKKTFTMAGYYQIQLGTQAKVSRQSDWCLGKLRAANNEKDKYVLYDNGESWDSKTLAFNNQNLRREYGAFMFRYELCNVGNIRKMRVVLP